MNEPGGTAYYTETKLAFPTHLSYINPPAISGTLFILLLVAANSNLSGQRKAYYKLVIF